MGTTVPWPFAATLTQVKAEGPATLKNRPNATMGHGGEVSPSYERMTVTPNDQFSSVIVIIVVFASLFWNILYLSMFSYLFLFCFFLWFFRLYCQRQAIQHRRTGRRNLGRPRKR